MFHTFGILLIFVFFVLYGGGIQFKISMFFVVVLSDAKLVFFVVLHMTSC